MPVFHAIAAMSENRAIAFQDKLPWHLPLEYRWFKHKTMGSTLIMGRKTREAIGKALPGRKNFVLTRQPVEFPETICFPGVEQLTTALPKEGVVWVVGGADIYRQFLPKCTCLYLSRIKRTTSGDIFFPPFENDFTQNEVIHENEDFRVERWLRHGAHTQPAESWPF